MKLQSDNILVVDLYNTLVRNTSRLNPYKKLFIDIKNINPSVNIPSREFFNLSMMYNGSITGLLKSLGINFNDEMINSFKLLIDEELNSIIFNEDLISDLSSQNKKIILLSNLSFEYSPPISELKSKLDIYSSILSFEVNLLKPNKDIFLLASQEGNATPKQSFMYGDNMDLDILGAFNSGYGGTKLVNKWW